MIGLAAQAIVATVVPMPSADDILSAVPVEKTGECRWIEGGVHHCARREAKEVVQLKCNQTVNENQRACSYNLRLIDDGTVFVEEDWQQRIDTFELSSDGIWNFVHHIAIPKTWRAGYHNPDFSIGSSQNLVAQELGHTLPSFVHIDEQKVFQDSQLTVLPTESELVSALPFGGHSCAENANGPTDCLASIVTKIRDLSCSRTESPERMACSYNALVEYFEGERASYWVQGVDMFEIGLNGRWSLLHEIETRKTFSN